MGNSLTQSFGRWFRRNIIWSNVIAIGFEVVIALLFWWVLKGRQTFGSLNSYGFIWLSIAIATIAALSSIRASIIASDSQRPFLSRPADTIKVNFAVNRVTIQLPIQNSGALPGSDVCYDIYFFDENEEVTRANRSSKYKRVISPSGQSILFPNNHLYAQFTLNLSKKDDMELWKNIIGGTVKLRLRITYRNFGRECSTIQTEKILPTRSKTNFILVPLRPYEYT